MAQVEDKDYGYKEFQKAMAAAATNPHIVAGIREEEGAQLTKSGATLAEIATYNEFGTLDGHIPPRPAFRGTMQKNNDAYVDQIAREAFHWILDHKQMARGFALLGQRVKRDIQNEIRDLRDPENAESTIRRKKSSNPLIDTGRLRDSIDYEFRSRTLA